MGPVRPTELDRGQTRRPVGRRHGGDAVIGFCLGLIFAAALDLALAIRDYRRTLRPDRRHGPGNWFRRQPTHTREAP
jgi:hypothetical protein